MDFLLLEFGVSAMSSAITNFGTLGRATLFAAVARTCGPFSPEPLRDRRVSVNALAASLGRPFETTRRTANALIDHGLFLRSESGLQVPASTVSDPRVVAFGDHCHDLLVRLIDDLRAGGLMLPPARADVAYDPRVGIGTAFDLLLAAFESRHADDRGLIRIALMTAVEWSNQRFAGTDLDRAQLAPVKPSTVARLLNLPYATVARNLEMLVREGALLRRPGGLVIADDPVDAVAEGEARAALTNRARQLIGRCAQAGFPTHAPASQYIAGRPQQAVLG